MASYHAPPLYTSTANRLQHYTKTLILHRVAKHHIRRTTPHVQYLSSYDSCFLKHSRQLQMTTTWRSEQHIIISCTLPPWLRLHPLNENHIRKVDTVSERWTQHQPSHNPTNIGCHFLRHCIVKAYTVNIDWLCISHLFQCLGGYQYLF